MVAFGFVRELARVATLGALLLAGCASGRSSSGASSQPASSTASAEPRSEVPAEKSAAERTASKRSASSDDGTTPASATLDLERTTPEPEVVPCKNCGIDIGGRVTGGFVDAKCGSLGPVVYPVSQPILEVLDGAQASSRFLVTTSEPKLAAGATLSGQTSTDAKPSGWQKAQIWVTDAAGKQCASPVSIYQ